MAKKKYDLEMLYWNRETWIKTPLEAIADNVKREKYKNRCDAVDLYIDGWSVSDIFKKTGIKASYLVKLLERVTTYDNGVMIGYQALLPGKHILASGKEKKDGRFQELLRKYPEIRELISGCYFGDKKFTQEKRMSVATIHKYYFLPACRDHGIQDYEYPFTVQDMGLRNLYTFIKELQKSQTVRAVHREDKDTRQKYMSTGRGDRHTMDAIAPYQEVQFDGHIIDLIYTVEVEGKDGGIMNLVATRAWLLVVIDVATRCVLGYSLSTEHNYNRFDVLEAFRNAVLPKEKMEFTFAGLNYPLNGGFPSLAFPELTGALFETIKLDNAKSHLSFLVQEKLVENVGCALSLGSVATPETRGIVERFFETLEMRGFHRLSATTGSNSRDPKRENAEKNAQKNMVSFRFIEESIEALIAEYNTTPHKALFNESPLECLGRRCIQGGIRPSIASDEDIEKIEKLMWFTEKRIVRGGISKGRSAYIRYEGVEYRNNLLTASDVYVGDELTLLINPRDISKVEAFDSSGSPLGVLKAAGEYGIKPHSLKTRKEAEKLARYNLKTFNRNTDRPLTDLERAYKDNAEKSKTARTKAERIRREQGKKTLSESAHEPSEIIKFNIAAEEKAPEDLPDVESEKDIIEFVKNHTVEEFYKKYGKGV